MRTAVRVLAALAVGGLLVVYLTRGAVPSPPDDPPSVPTPAGRAQPPTPEPPAGPLRNPFQYGEANTPAPDRAPVRRATPPRPDPDPPAPAPPAVRLTGFVEQGGQRRAALAVPGGEVVLAGPGEGAAGYTVIAFEGEEGVRVRTPGGSEIQLRLER